MQTPSAGPVQALAVQATLGAAFTLSGRGLHTGRKATVRVSPAEAETGIVFRRSLMGRWACVPALWHLREAQPLCTALRGPDGTLVRTVEHLMASLSAFGIDNATVDLDAEELPIFDGSALPWCAAIAQAGRQTLAAPRRQLRVRRTVEVRDGERSLRIEPSDGFSITGELALAKFGVMRWQGTVTQASFVESLAPSRSFGRLKWAVPLKLYAYATGRSVLRGANVRSTAAIFGNRIIGGMRGADEPVRHRLLDLVGDLALIGHPVLGHVTARHTGHNLNHALVAALLADPAAWELV
ncbi:UDP-3-O-acyl-N-acetylglucosamine deacetylase [Methylobacterium sp. J-090]|uniref:UDP-3-O-acyl-N-acetylglucosamine deacetylase n=1 Tax=Methylobacterium sp. J-090 TaxID=2836666 RepID=UPI001FBB486E|nr:UDP-3-O-acyl-N-acetylglucosamine deacetylase [Methylobacterium sp. J-090]MCJ2080970.1 UDP-3-O-acyl-N-acetylglucosamine deacetylase [Methylobacterium sp. J-090]